MIKKNGFTLVELIVTIAIILSVIGISVPSALSVMQKYKKKSHDMEIEGFMAAAESYVMDNKEEVNVLSLKDVSETNAYCLSLNDLTDKDYIKKIPNDPITGDKFVGSIKVYVEGNKITYKYSNDECTNKLVDADLDITISYDEYLNLGSVITDPNARKSCDDSISATDCIINNANLLVAYYNGDPGLLRYTSNGMDYYYYVGPTEENYVKIEGLTYPENSDYELQQGRDVLWRVLGVDKNNNTIRMISDAGIYYDYYNDINLIDGHVLFDIKNSQYFSNSNFKNTLIRENTYTEEEFKNFAYYDSMVFVSTIEPIKSLSGNYLIYNSNGYLRYYQDNYVAKTGDNRLKNLTFNNDILYYIVGGKSSITLSTTYDNDYMFTLKKTSSGYEIKEYNSSYEGTKYSTGFQYMLDWFNDNAISKNSSLFSDTTTCELSLDTDEITKSNGYKVSANYTDDMVNPYDMFNCNNPSGNKVTEKIGMLSALEYLILKGESSSTNSSMFRYNYKDFWTSSASHIYRKSYDDWRYYSYQATISKNDTLDFANIFEFINVDGNNGAKRSFRPVITLSDVAKISSGTGTKVDPYIVKLNG